AQRRRASQARQIAERCELPQAQDRVVSPIVAFAELPESQSACEHRTAETRGELHETREQRLPSGRQWQGLDDPRLRLRLHELREGYDRAAAHDAVRIEYDGIVVATAPRAHEVGDVAGLAADVLGPAPIEDAPVCLVPLDEGPPGGLFGDRDLVLAR